jgi:hypothetical protein
MTDNTRDQLLDAIQDIARKENDILYRDLRSEIGELEMRVNNRLAPLEQRMELPKRVTALILAAGGAVAGGTLTVVIEKLFGGSG